MLDLWIILFVAWAAGVVASYTELHGQRWHYHLLSQRVGLALLWPVTLIALIMSLVIGKDGR